MGEEVVVHVECDLSLQLIGEVGYSDVMLPLSQETGQVTREFRLLKLRL